MKGPSPTSATTRVPKSEPYQDDKGEEDQDDKSDYKIEEVIWPVTA
jgi:hypothetical protein